MESNLSKYERLKQLPIATQKQFISSLTPNEALDLQHDLTFMGRPKQQLPPGNWDVLLALAGRGFGKMLALDTPIATESGWTTMGEIKQTDKIFDENGNLTNIIAVHDIEENQKTYRVKFNDGSYIDACKDHLWSVKTARIRSNNTRTDGVSMPVQKPNLVKTTEELIPILTYGNRDNNNLSVDVTEPLILSDQQLPIDPYLFGYWLGDGTSSTFDVTTSKEDLAPFINNIYELDLDIIVLPQSASTSARTVRIKNGHEPYHNSKGYLVRNPKSMNGLLVSLNVFNNKHIPDIYLRASYEQRLALLQGLMDSDGTVANHAKYCTYNSCNIHLAHSVYELVMSLGMKATGSNKDAKIYGKVTGTDYRINFTPNIPIFRLQRKLDKVLEHAHKSQQSKHRHRMIIAIDEIDSVPMRCISVDSASKLYLAGRSMIPTHNSWMGSQIVHTWAKIHPGCRIALVGETTADVRDVMIKGDSGILKQAHPRFMPIYNPSTRLLTFPNCSIAKTFSGIEPGQLRGPQFHFAWVDELAKYRYQEELWNMLTMCLRLGTQPQTIITTTPRPTKLIKLLAKANTTVVVTGSSFENTELPQHTLDLWKTKYEGTRLGRQELYAEILVDNPNALFTIGNIIKNRIESHSLPTADRTVVAVDPAVTNNIDSDDTGIVVGKRKDDHGYLIHDGTMKGTPNDWANEAVRLYHLYEADCIVYENNQGGMMTEQLIHNIDGDIKVIGVRAFKNKQSRAEPVSALYEQDRIHHVGLFLELETEIVDFDPTLQQRSPNRLDALVYAFTELFGLNIVAPKVWSLN